MKPNFILTNALDHVAFGKDLKPNNPDQQVFHKNKTRLLNFAKRSVIVDNLVEGSLHIDVLLQYMHEETDQFHVPTNHFITNVLALLDSGDNADISFKVGDTIIPAHKFMLQINAPVLASLFK